MRMSFSGSMAMWGVGGDVLTGRSARMSKQYVVQTNLVRKDHIQNKRNETKQNGEIHDFFDL